MPKCKVCKTHFKFEGDKVCWLIKEQIGDDVCQGCKKEYLRVSKQKVVNNGKNIR